MIKYRTRNAPNWFEEEENKLINEWYETDTPLTLPEYAMKYGSAEYKEEAIKLEAELEELREAAKKTEAETGEKVYWG